MVKIRRKLKSVRIVNIPLLSFDHNLLMSDLTIRNFHLFIHRSAGWEPPRNDVRIVCPVRRVP